MTGSHSKSMGTQIPALPERDISGLEVSCSCQGPSLDIEGTDLLPDLSLGY